MSLLQPAFLFAMAAVAVPILLHLIFRRHTQIVRLGSIRFLDELVRETARRRKVRRWLLLAVRVGCLLLLAFLFARPYVRAAHQQIGERLIVMLIDQSASMSRRQEGIRLIDKAVERANEVVSGTGEEATLQVGLFDSDVSPADPDKRERQRITAPERLFGATSYSTALAWARDLCWKYPSSERDVYVLTDLQRSGLDWIDAEPMPAGVSVHVENMAEMPANNLAILTATAASVIVRPGSDTTVRATLFNYGTFEFSEANLRLTLESDGRQMHFEDTVSVPSQQSVDVQFDVPALKAGRWEGTLDVNVQDDLPFDNSRHLVILSRPQSRVMVVDGSSDDVGDSIATYFLARAIGLAPPGEVWQESPFRADVVNYEEAEELPSLAGVEIVVLSDCAPTAADVRRLQDFVENGGALLVFTGEQMTADACKTLDDAGLLPGEITGIRRTSDLPFRIAGWNAEHPALEPFSDPQNGDLRRFAFTAFTRIEPSPGTSVLAHFNDDESPAVTEHRLGTGTVYWVMSTASQDWNNACRTRLYLPFVHQLLGDGVGLTAGGPVQSATIDEWLKRNDSVSRNELRPGVFTQDDRSFVLSVAVSESDPEVCEASELADATQTEVDTVDGHSSVTAASAGPRNILESRADEWWPYVVLILLALLAFESLLANRTSA